MATKIYLGEPPARIKQWIINKYLKKYRFIKDEEENVYIVGDNIDPTNIVVDETLDEDGNLFVSIS